MVQGYRIFTQYTYPHESSSLRFWYLYFPMFQREPHFKRWKYQDDISFFSAIFLESAKRERERERDRKGNRERRIVPSVKKKIIQVLRKLRL